MVKIYIVEFDLLISPKTFQLFLLLHKSKMICSFKGVCVSPLDPPIYFW